MQIYGSKRPGGRNWRQLVLVISVFGLGTLAGYWNRYGVLPQATAAPPEATAKASLPAPTPPDASDNGHRWVAVIYGNMPITREDLGEYLIARQGQKLELLVNKRIIEHVCQEKGVEVTGAEVDAALAEDLKGMGGITVDQFVQKVLARYNKTLYEWKEDVLRPKLALTKLLRGQIHPTEQDFRDAFEAYYGEKVECRIILVPQGQEKVAMKIWEEIRKGDDAFDHEAKKQASPSLAATGGVIKPFGRHTTGNEELEKEAFSLQPGEISKLIGSPEGTVILKCIRRIPADTSKKLETEHAALEKEIIEKKIQQEMPKFFKEIQEQAQPKLFLKKYTTEEELIRDAQRELQSGATGPVSPAHKPPQGN